MSNSNSKLAIKEGWVSIVVNVALFVLKYWAGLVTGSVAIIADAWHTLSDSLSSIFVIVGVKISHKPADKEHPFGHGRSELITAILIGSLLAVIAFSFVKEGYGKLIHREMVKYGSIAIVATVVSIVIKEGLAQYAFWIGRKANSQSVIADGWHHRSDAISSVVVLVGILLGKYFWWIDGALGIIVALLILHAAYQVIKDASGVILGEEPTEELTQTIKTIIQQKGNGDLYPHHFHLHNYIQHKELTFHIRLPNDMRIEAAHEIATSIENDIHKATGIVTTIHIEPHTKKCE
jgi:cation diffusion facilitator family transporter